ncbi:MAG: hypothetical protein LLG01_05010 [Planctomycetaceae bacterium]|nr:hypothetical protein [Planctomycetaceae bacterium]
MRGSHASAGDDTMFTGKMPVLMAVLLERSSVLDRMGYSGDNAPSIAMEMQRKRKPWMFVAAVLAWLVPGAGHVYLGRPVRGAIIFIIIAATFWSGVGIGGVMTVDPREQRWWFIAQMFAGSHGLIGWRRSRSIDIEAAQIVHDKAVQKLQADRNFNANRYAASAAARQEALVEMGVALPPQVANVAQSYAGIAGLLNLLCIFDALVLAAAGVSGEPRREETQEPSR